MKNTTTRGLVIASAAKQSQFRAKIASSLSFLAMTELDRWFLFRGPMAKENPIVAYAKYSAIGIEFAVAAIVGVVGGSYIDSHFGIGPWGVFLGAILGLASGFYRLVTVLKEISDRREQNHSED